MTAVRRIGILAGGGSLPREIADSVAARGLPLHIVGIDGETDADFGPYPITRVNWGQIGRMVAAFKQTGCTELVIIGSVSRPDLGTIKPDMGFVRALGTVLGLVLSGGDDGVLRGVIRFFERHGFKVTGPADISPELVVGEGHFTQHTFAPETVEDIATGFYVIGTLGKFDIGQHQPYCCLDRWRHCLHARYRAGALRDTGIADPVKLEIVCDLEGCAFAMILANDLQDKFQARYAA